MKASSRRAIATGLVSLAVAAPALGVKITYFDSAGLDMWGIAEAPNGTVYYSTTGGLGYRTYGGAQGFIAAPTVGGQPFVLTEGADGRIWFTEQGVNKIGVLTPSSNGVIDYTIPTGGSPPKGLVYAGDPDGAYVLFLESATDKIAAFNFTQHAVNDASLTSGSGPNRMAFGPRRSLYFTQSGNGKIGRYLLDGSTCVPISSCYDEFAIPSGATSDPRGIAVGPDGNLWFTESGGNAIGRMTPTGGFNEFPLPNPNSQPQDIARGPDGNLWFTESNAARIGRITANGVITEFPVEAATRALALGHDGALWFTEASAARFGKLVPTVPGDVNGDGDIAVNDVFYLINFLFAGGPAPK
jgi:virginiamycin B lyase